ncbi:hypothetical protein ACFXP3_21345 [Streptomyces sp. NPDC059096]|uniref:hypothetical protein n=1 Tax=unclassified Streptomyces TaxID=2593676 RepID=UPI0036838AC7
MSMVSLLSDRAVQAFRARHGAMETWTSSDYDLYQDLLAKANMRRRPLRRLGRRARALALLAYVMPLYTLAELTNAVRGECWHRLELHLDVLDDRCSDAEDACYLAGDVVFVNRVGDFTDRYTDLVCRVSGHIETY